MEGKPKLSEERVEQLSTLEDILGYKFDDMTVLHNALTHRSFVNENQDLNYKDNERLEFLGDAVLELCISDILMKIFPTHTEGQLSKLRASVVNEQPLARLAEQYMVGDFLLLGKGEETSGGRHKYSILADTFEAIIASIYLDGGFDKAHLFIDRVFGPAIEEWTDEPFFHDYKTYLQELSQSRFRVIPRYCLLHEYGPDHDKIFQIKLTVADIVSTSGIGKSKKEAEQQAAKRALEELQKMEEERTRS